MTKFTCKQTLPAAFLASSLLLAACGAAPAQAESRSAEITRGSVTSTVSATGNVQAREEAKVAFTATGIVAQVRVRVGDTVRAGDVMATLETSDAEHTLAKARLSFKNAESALIIAHANYSKTIEGPVAADIQAAQAALAAARASQGKVLAGPKPADNAAAAAKLRNAEASLRRAQWAYNAAYNNDPATITSSGEALQLEQATNDYNAAKAEYDRLSLPADAADKAAAKQRVADALAQLNKARQSVRAYDVDRAAAERAQAQIQLEQARLDVRQAERKLAQLSLLAPFAGVVSAVDVKTGESAGPQSTVTLVDIAQLITDINVDEVDIAKVRDGQEVTIRLDAAPGDEIKGTVMRISPTSKLVNGVVTYSVRVTIPAAQGAQPSGPKPGMTANTRIVLERRNDVLLVPNWAVRRDRATGATFVTIPAADNKTQELEVKLGLKDDDRSEVLSGVSDGQKLLEPKPLQ